MVTTLTGETYVTDRIGYENLTQAAMRGVVRGVLKQTSEQGAPLGDHHFFITFRTKAPGVKIADHLVERFAKDMTIVIQHQYWDLEVHDTHFEIILKFSGVPQHLHIPSSAITRFVDPSVNFGLNFEAAPEDSEENMIAPVIDDAPAQTASEQEAAPSGAANTVVNLDAFRRK